MKILFVASRFPYPPFQGDRLRGFHQLRHLSRSHDCVLITPPFDSDDPADRRAAEESVHRYCRRIEVVPYAHQWRRWSRVARAPFSRLPLQTLYSFDPAFRQRVVRVMDQEAFDVMHVQLVRMAPVIEGLGGIPKVIDLIDAMSLNMSRRACRQRGVGGYVAAFEAGRVRAYEKRLASCYDHLVVSSSLDREVLGGYDHLHIVPNGVDLDDEEPLSPAELRDPRTIVLSGRMSYYPNVDAAVWFAREVFPLVRRRVPDAQFRIVGADPAPTVQRLAEMDGVTVTGRVPEIKSHIARAAVAVAPLRAGSGMQLKVIEAMASGTAVVATPYALGGVDVTDGEHLFIGETAPALAKHVVSLMECPEMARQVAANARRLVADRYTWRQSVALLEQVYRRACSLAPDEPAAQPVA